MQPQSTVHDAGGTPNVSTLDEPVLDTITRDLKAIARKTAIVVVPVLGRENELRDWDLWGPLLLCVVEAMILSLGNSAESGQGPLLFAAVFALVWIGSAVVTINAQFLGAKLSFFQAVCVMGYCIAPMVIFSLIALFLPSKWYIRIPIAALAWFWSTYASLRFFRGCVIPQREGLVLYPIALFFLFMAWMMATAIK